MKSLVFFMLMKMTKYHTQIKMKVMKGVYLLQTTLLIIIPTLSMPIVMEKPVTVVQVVKIIANV